MKNPIFSKSVVWYETLSIDIFDHPKWLEMNNFPVICYFAFMICPWAIEDKLVKLINKR